MVREFLSDTCASFAGPSADAEHEQEGERGAEDDVRQLGQGLGAAGRPKGPQDVDQGARRTLALVGNQGVLTRGAQQLALC